MERTVVLGCSSAEKRAGRSPPETRSALCQQTEAQETKIIRWIEQKTLARVRACGQEKSENLPGTLKMEGTASANSLPSVR